MVRALLATALLLLLVAGCSAPAPSPAAQDAPGALFETSDGGPIASGDPSKGGIVGVVVDEAIRPLAGAVVQLDGDLTRSTAEDGSFSFVDVPEGAHFLGVAADGFTTSRHTIEVVPGEIVQVRVLLQATPPAQATWVTQKFDGFVQATNAGDNGTAVAIILWVATGETGCDRCTFRFQAEPGINTTVLEATMSPNSFPGGSNGFAYTMTYGSGAVSASFSQPNPMNVQVPMEGNEGTVELVLHVGSDPVPETNKAFQVFVTTFYGAAPPPGFSAIA